MSRAAIVCALLLLAGCGGSGPRHSSYDGAYEGGGNPALYRSGAGHAGGGNFMGRTRERCDNGDAGACRILHAMGD